MAGALSSPSPSTCKMDYQSPSTGRPSSQSARDDGHLESDKWCANVFAIEESW